MYVYRANNSALCRACETHQALTMVENVNAPSLSVVVSGALQSINVQLLPKSWQSFCRRALTARQECATPHLKRKMCHLETYNTFQSPLRCLDPTTTCGEAVTERHSKQPTASVEEYIRPHAE